MIFTSELFIYAYYLGFSTFFLSFTILFNFNVIKTDNNYELDVALFFILFGDSFIKFINFFEEVCPFSVNYFSLDNSIEFMQQLFEF